MNSPENAEDFLAAQRAQALAGLTRSGQNLGAELTGALERSMVGRHPLLVGGAALALAFVSGPTLVRVLGPVLGLLGTTTERALAIAPLAIGFAKRRLL
jgi:hypothetical protein